MKRDKVPVKLVGEIIEECRDRMSDLDTSIMDLENDPKNKDILNTIFRAFHTIKGSSAVVDEFKPITEFAHLVESLLTMLRDGKIEMHRDVSTVLLNSVDILFMMISKAEDKVDIDADTGTINEEIGLLMEGKTINRKDGSKNSLDTSLIKKEKTLRVDVSKIDKLLSIIGELHINERMASRMISLVKKNISGITSKMNMLKMSSSSDIIDDYKEMLLNFENLLDNTDRVDLIIDELKSVFLQMRMVPIKQLFSRASRIVRDASMAVEKNIEINSYGDETEVDRNVIEMMYDPLIHIMRNAIDHGIETKKERKKTGKPLAGSITLRATHREGSIVLEISDDGQGMDIEKIKEKAIQKELYTRESLEKMDEKEILNIIFLPGFSTKDETTELSGRGVGMDVITHNVKRLRGDISFFSEKGKGMKFIIKLPTTLLISESLLVEVEGERFVIPVEHVSEVVKVTSDELTQIGNSYTYRFDDRDLPVIELKGLFYNSYSQKLNGNTITLVAVKYGKNVAAFQIDKVLHFEEIVIKGTGTHLTRIPMFDGATILDDGSVSLILDVKEIIEGHSSNRGRPSGSNYERK